MEAQVAPSAFRDRALELKMKLLFKAGPALVRSWSPTGMSKCRLETVRSSRGPAHSGNSMCFAVTFSRSVITQPKPESDDVISPNNSPFAEPVIIVYTFPCQSAGVPLLCFFSPIGSCCCDLLLETNILSWAQAAVPTLWVTDVWPCIMYVPVGFFMISGSALDQEAGGGLRMKLHSFTSMSCRGTRFSPVPLMSLD